MKIVSGMDLVEINRLRALSPAIKTRFLARVFTDQERMECRSDESLAGKFAAKEAAAKALGTGIGLVRWQDLEILSSPSGAPHLFLHRRAADLAAEIGIVSWTVSISHTYDIAGAQVIGAG